MPRRADVKADDPVSGGWDRAAGRLRRRSSVPTRTLPAAPMVTPAVRARPPATPSAASGVLG